MTSALARNYQPLPVEIAFGEGAWVSDSSGRRYLDMLAGYSALNFGHRHPQLVAAAHRQLDRITLTSRAFGSDQLEPFCAELAALCGKDLVLPMNSGAEAVETALKVARKWGYEVKGVAPGHARIIVAAGNFHGRTISIIGFSDDQDARTGFEPFPGGFVSISYGDSAALAAAFDDDTVAVLIEPIQGEAGVIIPPAGYLAEVRRLCTANNVLMIADEIQSGLGRTGATFACDHESVVPDIYILGKALGGGIVPLSAVVADQAVLGVLRPGQHGSTFGGNPLACAIGRAVLDLLRDGQPQRAARELGVVLADTLEALPSDRVAAVRVRGLWAGIDVLGRTGRETCENLLNRGVLAKDTHDSTIRLAPPLVISHSDLEWGLARVTATLAG